VAVAGSGRAWREGAKAPDAVAGRYIASRRTHNHPRRSRVRVQDSDAIPGDALTRRTASACRKERGGGRLDAPLRRGRSAETHSTHPGGLAGRGDRQRHALIGTPFPQRSPPWLIHRRSLRWLEASPCKATPEGLRPQRLDYRPKLRVLTGKLLIGRTRIDRHHTIITNSLPRSTNDADDLTSCRYGCSPDRACRRRQLPQFLAL
jgi:hypothetical protein